VGDGHKEKWSAIPSHVRDPHTFATWALAAGESPEWVARTLGQVNTSMVYRTYGRYIPNLTRHDGSAFEGFFSGP